MNKSRISNSPKEVIYIKSASNKFRCSPSIDINKCEPTIDYITNCIVNGQLIDEKYYRQTTGIDYLL